MICLDIPWVDNFQKDSLREYCFKINILNKIILKFNITEIERWAPLLKVPIKKKLVNHSSYQINYLQELFHFYENT